MTPTHVPTHPLTHPPQQSCVDNSKVFLSPASGCTKFEKCSLNTYVDHVSKKVRPSHCPCALPVPSLLSIRIHT